MRIPGISLRRMRGSARWRRTRWRFGSSSPRSIFGARLRTRCPQYGHSVTYGLTSDPQFLQTTNRSGCDTQIRGYPRGIGGRGGFGLESRLLDDLCHHFAEIVVGLVDDQLASAAVAAVEDVLDAVEVVGRAQLLGVRADPLQDPLRQLLGRHPCRLRQVDQLALEAVASSDELVLVEHLVWEARQLLPSVEVIPELLHERLDE